MYFYFLTSSLLKIRELGFFLLKKNAFSNLMPRTARKTTFKDKSKCYFHSQQKVNRKNWILQIKLLTPASKMHFNIFYSITALHPGYPGAL